MVRRSRRSSKRGGDDPPGGLTLRTVTPPKPTGAKPPRDDRGLPPGVSIKDIISRLENPKQGIDENGNFYNSATARWALLKEHRALLEDACAKKMPGACAQAEAARANPESPPPLTAPKGGRRRTRRRHPRRKTSRRKQ